MKRFFDSIKMVIALIFIHILASMLKIFSQLVINLILAVLKNAVESDDNDKLNTKPPRFF